MKNARIFSQKFCPLQYTYVCTYRIVGVFYESFNFANFANREALAKIKASIYFWINIVQTKCIARN